MFSSRKSLAVKDAIFYCKTMFAGMEIFGKPIPMQAYSDAYVLGFLQQIIIYAILDTYKVIMPHPIITTRVTERVIDKFLPRFGRKAIQIFTDLNKQTHIGHVNYGVGRREGTEYVNAMINNDEAKAQAIGYEFRNFIRRNYMS